MFKGMKKTLRKLLLNLEGFFYLKLHYNLNYFFLTNINKRKAVYYVNYTFVRAKKLLAEVNIYVFD